MRSLHIPLLLAVVFACAVGPAALAGQTPAPSASGAASKGDVNGFKVGDVVEVDTAFGWADAQVLALNGNNYQVRVNGVVVTKLYPVELHRKGTFTDRDHAVGLYDLKDRVQVNVQGQGWVDGTVITRRALEYQVQLPGDKTAWASGNNIRYVGAPAAAVAPKAGTPPKPGFVSCAGKIEGRYAPSNGMPGLTIVFRAGSASVSAMMGDDEVFECWTSESKIILRDPKHPDQDIPIDINKDGTLDTPLGELKKKGD